MELRLLGPVGLWSGGGQVHLGTPRQRCVLAVLAMTPGQPVPASTLVDRVWGEQLPAHVREVLYSYVSRLRGQLALADEDGGPARLRRENGGYVLDIDADRVDLHRARGLVSRARALRGGPAGGEARAAELLGEACALWRGTPLAGLSGDWADRARDALSVEHLAVLTERFEAELQVGRHVAAVGPLAESVADFPLAESLVGLLMLALYRSGRQADALQAYAQLRRRVVEEIGDEPGTGLRTLHQQILRREPCLEAFGESPEQAGIVGRANGQVTPAQLPPDVAAFTGRARELRQLDALLPDGIPAQPVPVAISVIEGAAGIGKTSLAVHWAHRVRDRFSDGQLYVDLRGHSPEPLQPAAALARLLRALGMPAERVPAEADEATGMYRSLLADKRVLLILDNAADPEQVRPLLPGGGGCLVLVTGREGLAGLVARDGAYLLSLDVLSPEEAHQLLARLLAADRTRGDPQPVAELAKRCGYRPLALRATAARLAAAAACR